MAKQSKKSKEAAKAAQAELLKKTEEFTSDLCQQLAAGANPDLMKRWLDQVGMFHKYSRHNQLLIWGQMPQATMINSYKRWQKLGRQVIKGTKAIYVLAPRTYTNTEEDAETGEEKTRSGMYFVGVPVFDISQTDGDPLDNLYGDLEGARAVYDAAKQFAQANGISVEEVALDGFADGAASDGLIELDTRAVKGSTDGRALCTILHELAHQHLHVGPDAEETSREIEELEAEAVAYTCIRHYGYEPNEMSALYITTWGGDVEKVQQSMEHIVDAVQSIIEGVSEYYEAPAEVEAEAS